MENLDPHIVAHVAHELLHGRIIIYPTETIYGIGADAFNPYAIDRIYAIKQRERGKPLLVLTNTIEMVKTLVAEIPPITKKFIQHFWPGPLTIIFNASHNVTPKLTGGTGTLGIRMTNHPFCLQVIKICNRPLISTSANLSGEDVVQEVPALVQEFFGQVDLIIDGGSPAQTLPSTVVDVTHGTVKIIREGVIPKTEIDKLL